MTEKVRPGTIRPFTREDVLNALARAGAKAVARAQALGLEPVIRSQEEALRDWEKEKSERAAERLSRSQGA